MLEICVHKYQKLSGGVVQPRCHRGFMSEVPGKAQASYVTAIPPRELPQNLPAPVLRAVIYKKELVIITELPESPAGAVRLFIEAFQSFFFIVDGDDETDLLQILPPRYPSSITIPFYLYALL